MAVLTTYAVNRGALTSCVASPLSVLVLRRRALTRAVGLQGVAGVAARDGESRRACSTAPVAHSRGVDAQYSSGIQQGTFVVDIFSIPGSTREPPLPSSPLLSPPSLT